MVARQILTATEEWCFLCRPCRNVINRIVELMQRLQNKVLRIIGSFPRHTPVRDLHMAFKLPYIYDYITKLCRQQAEVIQNHDNENVRNTGQGEARHGKYNRHKLGCGQAYDRSSD
jgi:hypothetical protein